jgi:hypothetical protein
VLPVDYFSKRRDTGTDQHIRKDRCRGVPHDAQMPFKTLVEPIVHATTLTVSGQDRKRPGRFGIQAFHRGSDQICRYGDTIFREWGRTYAPAHGLAGKRMEVAGHREELVGWHDLFRGS